MGASCTATARGSHDRDEEAGWKELVGSCSDSHRDSMRILVTGSPVLVHAEFHSRDIFKAVSALLISSVCLCLLPPMPVEGPNVLATGAAAGCFLFSPFLATILSMCVYIITCLYRVYAHNLMFSGRIQVFSEEGPGPAHVSCNQGAVVNTHTAYMRTCI